MDFRIPTSSPPVPIPPLVPNQALSVARAQEDDGDDMEMDPKRGEKRVRETLPSPPPHVAAPTVRSASSLALTQPSDQASTDVLMIGRQAVWNPDGLEELSIDLAVEEETISGAMDSTDDNNNDDNSL